jgi:hypothetical protein
MFEERKGKEMEHAEREGEMTREGGEDSSKKHGKGISRLCGEGRREEGRRMGG